MEQSELFDLIPLYVTGTLSKDQKATIEKALAESGELRNELAFWQAAKGAANVAAASLAGAHLSSEVIVDYARGVFSNSADVLKIQQHLQSCASCHEDYEIVHKAFLVKSDWTQPRHFVDRFPRVLLSMLRPRYSISALAVLMVCVLLFRNRSIGPDQQSVDFILSYQPQERSIESASLPMLSLNENVSLVRLSVLIPRAAVQPDQYSLMLFTPRARQVPLQEELAWRPGSSDFDSASISVPVLELNQVGTYALTAIVSYRGTSRAFEYNYRFKVVRED